MPRGKKFTAEQIIGKLREAEVGLAQGKTVPEVVPDHIRSDNGSEFTAKRVREWLERVGVKTLSIEPGSPWENGYVESFIGKLRDELMAREVFDTLLEAKVLIEHWRRGYPGDRHWFHSWGQVTDSSPRSGSDALARCARCASSAAPSGRARCDGGCRPCDTSVGRNPSSRSSCRYSPGARNPSS